MIRREETAGTIEIIGGRARRRVPGAIEGKSEKTPTKKGITVGLASWGY